MNHAKYVGRFAPSPTGPLHYGSLVAATASFLQAKHNNGRWLIRIEDIDPPREVAGAAGDILATLKCYQFEWDQEPLYQSTRNQEYRAALNTLINRNKIYACNCSRKDLSKSLLKSDLGKRYPGTCKNKNLDLDDKNIKLRLHVSDHNLSFYDEHFGQQIVNLHKQIGDVVIYRKHALPSYALAVTVDDAFQEVTEVVRGVDLLSFTPIQLYLCYELNLTAPKFLHIPIITNQLGQKLSKQTGAKPLDKKDCGSNLIHALNDLGQKVPKEFADLVRNKPQDRDVVTQIWSWAFEHWDKEKIPNVKQVTYKP